MKRCMRLFSISCLFVLLSMLGSGCRTTKFLPVLVKPVPPPLIRVDPGEYPSFHDTGNRNALLRALENQISYCNRLKIRAIYPLGDKSISSGAVLLTLQRFVQILKEADDADLNRIIADNFDLYQSTGEGGSNTVTFTGYYLPRIDASLTADDIYRYPLYRLPDDLILREEQGTRRAVRRENGREYPYYTRKQIDQEGVLEGRGYEIAFLKDPFDCYLLHVQGSGILHLPDDRLLSVRFAGSNYHPYRSLREEMLKDGILHPDNASMDAIRSYFASHPEKLQTYLNRNKRYTFFSTGKEEAVGSLGVELIPERSIATDKQIFPSGALSYIVTTAPSPDGNESVPWSRFVLNQDEGGAIRGPHRVDIFWGTGPDAEYIAHHMKQPGRLYFLLLKGILD